MKIKWSRCRTSCARPCNSMFLGTRIFPTKWSFSTTHAPLTKWSSSLSIFLSLPNKRLRKHSTNVIVSPISPSCWWTKRPMKGSSRWAEVKMTSEMYQQELWSLQASFQKTMISFWFPSSPAKARQCQTTTRLCTRIRRWRRVCFRSWFLANASIMWTGLVL